MQNAPPQIKPPVASRKTILLVEDEENLRFINMKVLSLLGYNVLQAENGHEALGVWKDHHQSIDLLLTDMRMPKGMTGLELAKRLGALKPSLKVIITSGYNIEHAGNEGSIEIPYKYISKPFNLDVLAETVRSSLQ